MSRRSFLDDIERGSKQPHIPAPGKPLVIATNDTTVNHDVALRLEDQALLLQDGVEIF